MQRHRKLSHVFTFGNTLFVQQLGSVALELYWKNILAIALLLLFFVGAFFTLREEYHNQLKVTDSKVLALLNAINDYVIKDLLATLVGAFLILVIGAFLLGGVVGLMIFGWKELLTTIGLISLLS